MSRIEIEFPEQLLRDYVTITETQADMNNVKFLSKKQTDLERTILIIVKGVASDILDEDNDLLTNSHFSNMPKFPSTTSKKYPACKGPNCGATDGVSHSHECASRYDKTHELEKSSDK